MAFTPVASVRVSDTQEVVFAIDAGHNLFVQVEAANAAGQFIGTPNGWKQIATGIKSVDAFNDVNGLVGVLAVDTGGNLFERLALPTALANASWTQIGSGVASVFAAGAAVNGKNDLLAIDTSGKLFEKQATPGLLATGSWTQIGTGIKQVAADFNATANRMDFLALDNGGKLFEQQEGVAPATANGWNLIGTGIKQAAIAFNPDTTLRADILAVDDSGKLFEQQEGATPATANGWTAVATGIKEVQVAEDDLTQRTEIFAIDTGGKLFVQQEGPVGLANPGAWQQIGTGIASVTVPFGGPPAVYALDATGKLFEQSPLVAGGNAVYGPNWVQIGTGIEAPPKGI